MVIIENMCFNHRENANDIKAKFIIEAANHPTDPEADEVSTYDLINCGNNGDGKASRHVNG